MAKDESFDITTGADLQEVANAVNQARKEIGNRFDFKGMVAEIDYEHGTNRLVLHAQDDYKLEAMWQVLMQRMVARGVPVKNLVRGTVQKASGGTVRQEVTIVQGLEPELARKIVKFIKERKYKKAQAQVQGDAVRVSSPSRDELQQVIADVRAENWGVELRFGNYR
ncbi:YajQ family cyclic di-GMP-binding protein [Tepidiforma sp.]|uniref:YajQ family cyclic di-GMP-binding protein n=1 Tax=Tepidiforma sp. TaxID=2682230 RepID=UPI002ADE53FA|nr:YajQ family cyclic di-GMP-binding protein [Tepidiforma sp.]